MDGDWRVDLDAWLAPSLAGRGGAGRGRKAQRSMCPAYIAGLIGLDDRKSIQPMAARTSEIPYDRLQQSRSPSLPSSDL
ncbi:DDE superfamily endonuclease [Gluconacetobacter diazotrophicus]|uniref:transposase n=1 Tax=Gluconacetobacter diazotrophicus TaxID=33996 RepID=UPI00119BC6CC|nr:DDE superfamily endonuclease [Gluconacetobacter diazotrophicus]